MVNDEVLASQNKKKFDQNEYLFDLKIIAENFKADYDLFVENFVALSGV